MMRLLKWGIPSLIAMLVIWWSMGYLGGLAAPAAAGKPALTLALVGGVPGETDSALYLLPLDGEHLPAAAARFEHVPGAVLRANVLPVAASVLVAVDRQVTRDLSWAAELLLLEPGKAARVVSDRVAHGSRPLISPQGRIFVERGRSGPPLPDTLRVDEVTVDEVFLDARPSRTIYAGQGYGAHLAGWYGGELVLYLVAPGKMDLVAIDADSGKSRKLVNNLPLARDFSSDDHGRLVFLARDLAQALWTIERVDLGHGTREILWRGLDGRASPHTWPGGRVVYNAGNASGLAILGEAAWNATGREGIEVVEALSYSRKWAAALHYPPTGDIPSTMLIDASNGQHRVLPGLSGVRLEIAGFIEGQP